jgi:hypothetical protein
MEENNNYLLKSHKKPHKSLYTENNFTLYTLRLTQIGAPRQHTPTIPNKKNKLKLPWSASPRTMLHTRKHTPTIPKNTKKLNIKDNDRSHKIRCKCNGGTSKIANEEEGSDCGPKSTRTNRRTMDGWMYG